MVVLISHLNLYLTSKGLKSVLGFYVAGGQRPLAMFVIHTFPKFAHLGPTITHLLLVAFALASFLHNDLHCQLKRIIFLLQGQNLALIGKTLFLQHLNFVICNADNSFKLQTRIDTCSTYNEKQGTTGSI